jgi:hypothetical protein
MPDGGWIGKADGINPAVPQKKGGQCDRPIRTVLGRRKADPTKSQDRTG